MTTTLPARSDIPEKYTWDLASIFADESAWEAATEQLIRQLGQIEKFKGRLNESPAVLADCLELTNTTQINLGKIFVYGRLPANTNTNDQEALAQSDRTRGLYGQMVATLAFIQPELIAIGFDTLREWMTQEPRLADYAHSFERIEKEQAHVRSAEIEEILGMTSDVFGTANATHSILANGELPFQPAIGSDGQEYPVSQSTIRALVAHTDREVRRTAYENYADAHLAFQNTMANALTAGIKRDVFIARARRYPDSLTAALSSNHIPVEVFHNLIETYKKNLPTWHKYWRIRRQALGYSELYEYDIKAPLSANPPVVTYEEAVEMIAAGMAPLGDEYVDILKRGCLQERWVDVLPNQGKRMGAFSSGSKGTHPFIMMSFTPDLQGMSTLAHELGHSLHSYYTRQNQEIVSYTNYGLFAAEVASNFNQALVRAYLFDTHDDRDFLITLIEEAMSNFHRYFFIMPTLARFELEIHQRTERGQALPAKDLNKLVADLFREGYGDELKINEDRVGITWAEFHTHMYSNFYVYQYATGISGAHALADRVRKGGAQAAKDYVNFLKAGGSMYPLDVLKLAGVDMTSPEPVEKAFAVLAEYVDRLGELTDASL
ncbi:MAG: oligoendopeptidase F [Ardenticatenaceae bacterium]|nr:oligoendopeptidase F [Ardenticatenaceae bacterium]